jgi:hypothetical protein
VHPDGGLAAGGQYGGNGSESLAQTSAVFAMAQHLQQPVGQREQQRKREQRTVERVHEEKFHSMVVSEESVV